MHWIAWACVASVILSAVAVLFSLKACGIAARGCVRSVSLQKLATLEADLTETHQLIESIRASLHRMRSRDAATKRNLVPKGPDLSDPVAYKRALRAQLQSQGKLNGRFHLGTS